ncbi:MAG: RNA polymerase sigma-54 factor, partial [Calditrichaeota bacterium]
MIRLQQRLAQKQIQSPQQVLLSSLLQLPLLKFEQQIKLELEANPLLEAVEEMELEQEELQEEDQEMELDLKKDDDEKEEEKDKEEEIDGGDAVEEIDKGEEMLDESDWESILGDESMPDTRAPKDESAEIFERQDVAMESLSEHLLHQLHMTKLTPEEYEIGEYIIWNINEVGYLSCDTSLIAHNLDVPEEKVLKVLKIIQRFDPVGIGARNLQECLLIQLEEQEHRNELAIEIIRDHYNDFSNKRFVKITKAMDITMDQLRDALTDIMKLNPKPGEGYV